MKRIILAIVLASTFLLAGNCTPPPAHADDGFVCPYPLVGVGATVRIGLEAGGKFCDGPTEVNGTHYHCEAGGATVSGGGIGLAPFNGFTFGGILGGGFGGGGSSCTWRCPDNTMGRAPNPPGAWKEYLAIRDKNNDCLGHMEPAGFWSEPVEPDQGPPGFENPHEPPQPMLPTVTNPGQGNPDDLPE